MVMFISKPITTRIIEQHHSKWSRIEHITFLIILTLLAIASFVTSDRDPYEVLGVRHDASLEQIKRAYRDLARKLHPDKSNTSEDESGRRFIELNKAFNLLKDPIRRSRYDQYGEIEENRHSRGYHQGGSFGERPTRNGWSTHNGFRTFTFYTSSDSYYRKKSITTQQYYGEYLKESKQRPFLIFFYVDLCPTCSMIESIWIKLTEELAKYNVGAFTINVQRESRLAQELGVSSIPQIACLINGQVYHYYQSEISISSLVRFIKNSLPNNLVPLLKSEREQDKHIATSSEKNRLSAIIIDNESIVKLRYILLAYALRHHYSFGYVSTKQSDYTSIFRRYNITDGSRSHLLVFNERFDKPLVQFDYHPDNFSTVHYIRQLLNWPYLKLPRLSSQQRFDELCLFGQKTESSFKKPALCVILFASATPSFLPVREKMIEFIELNALERDDKVVFAYIDPHKQDGFIRSLLAETVTSQPEFVRDSIHSSIILIERHLTDSRKAYHTWIGSRWDPKSLDELDKAKIELYKYISAYKEDSFRPTSKLLLSQLVDEEGPSLLQRMYRRFIDTISRTAFYLASRESFSAIMILVACALITSLFLYKSPVASQFTVPEREYSNYCSSDHLAASQKKSSLDSRGVNSSSQPKRQDDELKIIELKAETYNGMVRLLKPGYRSIIVLTDAQTKDKLISNFKNAVWPYRRNKTLLFGYLCLDKNLVWYKTLLEQILNCENLKVNKKNCIGTVLSLNGFKKYLRVYHAKHHEIDYYDDTTENDGSFLGFGDREGDLENGIGGVSESDREVRNVEYTVDNLLDKLPIWLDKMFDGLTKRYFIDEWPEEIN